MRIRLLKYRRWGSVPSRPTPGSRGNWAPPRGAPEPTADLRHVLGRLDEPGLVDQVALFLAPHGRLDHAAEMVVGDSRPHEVAQRRFLQREQARAQAALGGEPNAVAGRAE